MLLFLFQLSTGFYIGLIVVLLAAVYSREQVETVETVAPRLIEAMGLDSTNYGRN
jgi:sulfur transfer protein SufE